jgi:septum formation protein
MSTATRLVLASTSPARRALFDQIGLHYEAVSPQVDEILELEGDPVAQARELARAKAAAVAARFPDATVVAADQVLAFEGEVWGKPATAEDALRQLQRLAGRTHALVCGVAIFTPRERIVEHEETQLTMRALSPAELDAYVRTGEWQGCAGAYRIEAKGLALFERIVGDYTNVLGLPMLRVLSHLRRLEVPLFPAPSKR